MLDVVTAIDIARPRHVVAAFAADPDTVTEWYENIYQSEWLTPKPLRTGSRIAFVARFLGRNIRYTYEVSQWRVDEKLVMRGIDGPFPMETTYEWIDCGSGTTQMTIRNRGGPTGFLSLFAPIIRVAVRRGTSKSLQRLKQLLEEPRSG